MAEHSMKQKYIKWKEKESFGDFIIKNPDKDWNYSMLSLNPNITWDIVRDNPEKNWNYDALTYNPNITRDIILKNVNKPWDWSYFITKIRDSKWITLCSDPKITWDI